MNDTLIMLDGTLQLITDKMNLDEMNYAIELNHNDLCTYVANHKNSKFFVVPSLDAVFNYLKLNFSEQ